MTSPHDPEHDRFEPEKPESRNPHPPTDAMLARNLHATAIYNHRFAAKTGRFVTWDELMRDEPTRDWYLDAADRCMRVLFGGRS